VGIRVKYLTHTKAMQKTKEVAKKLALVAIGAVIGLSYFIAYTEYFEIKGF